MRLIGRLGQLCAAAPPAKAAAARERQIAILRILFSLKDG
jgi:hypothetical protein